MTLADGQSVLADTTVLAIGHFASRPVDALRPLGSSGLYVNDPWTTPFAVRSSDRVLLVGTGLTMADVACKLAATDGGPKEIVAISRRGLLSKPRPAAVPIGPALALNPGALRSARTLREMVSRVRLLMAQAEAHGTDWRDVMLALREHVPDWWRRLDCNDRKRFIRHVQPYWDVHRHQTPPQVGRRLQALMAERRLCVRAARIVSARAVNGGVAVGLRARGAAVVEPTTFQLVINCSGPDTDPRRAESPLLRSMLATGQVTPDETGLGLQVDAHGRLVGRHGGAERGLYYLGPWLRSRDLEATAVQELRQHATGLAERLRGGVDLAVARTA